MNFWTKQAFDCLVGDVIVKLNLLVAFLCEFAFFNFSILGNHDAHEHFKVALLCELWLLSAEPFCSLLEKTEYLIGKRLSAYLSFFLLVKYLLFSFNCG